MGNPTPAVHRTTDDMLWESALRQLTAEGLVDANDADVVRGRHDALAMEARGEDRRHRLGELAAYAGAALTIVGISAISTRVRDRFDESVQGLLLGGLALVMLTAATTVSVLTPGGSGALREPAEAARRRLVGVLGIAGAALASASISLTLQGSLPPSADVRWMPLAFLVGLLVAVATSRVAPGVVPTLAVLAFLAMSVMSTIDAFGRIDTPWAVPLAGVLLGAFGALLLTRVLTPAVLVQALSLAAWLGAAAGALAAEPDPTIDAAATDIAVWIGRVALAVLVILGAALFARGGGWPWAAGAAVGLAVLVQFTFAGALGAAVAMIIAGAVLVATSVVLVRTRKDSAREPHG